jgi:hypothetical protein
MRNLEEEFWSRVEKTDTCWLWTGGRTSAGYGAFHLVGKGNYEGAHRYSFTLAGGFIPDKWHVCHSCDVKLCVNPSHLFVGTSGANQLDSLAKGRRRLFWNAESKRKVRGEGNTNAKLTDEVVRKIRKLRSAGVSLKEVAAEFDVAPSTVSMIANHRYWNHIDDAADGSSTVI